MVARKIWNVRFKDRSSSSKPLVLDHEVELVSAKVVPTDFKGWTVRSRGGPPEPFSEMRKNCIFPESLMQQWRSERKANELQKLVDKVVANSGVAAKLTTRREIV